MIKVLKTLNCIVLRSVFSLFGQQKIIMAISETVWEYYQIITFLKKFYFLNIFSVDVIKSEKSLMDKIITAQRYVLLLGLIVYSLWKGWDRDYRRQVFYLYFLSLVICTRCFRHFMKTGNSFHNFSVAKNFHICNPKISHFTSVN